MSEELRFGIFVPVQFLPFPVAVEQCQFVETLGYDSLWLGVGRRCLPPRIERGRRLVQLKVHNSL